MHPLSHPRNALAAGALFVAVAFVFWLFAGPLGYHVDFAGVTMLFALGIAMALLAYTLIAGSPRD
jgi:hypothetical protein